MDPAPACLRVAHRDLGSSEGAKPAGYAGPHHIRIFTGSVSKVAVTGVCWRTWQKRQPRPSGPEPNAATAANGSAPSWSAATRLAVHFGCVRSYVETLAQQGVIERRTVDGLFDMDQSRLRYIAHLRSERARSPKSTGDAEHTAAKTEMLRLKLAVQRRELVRQSDVDDLISQIAGITLTALSSMPSCAPVGDLATRRKLEACVFQCRKDIAVIATAMADKAGEPPLSEQG
jgi:hypothetical protein